MYENKHSWLLYELIKIWRCIWYRNCCIEYFFKYSKKKNTFPLYPNSILRTRSVRKTIRLRFRNLSLWISQQDRLPFNSALWDIVSFYRKTKACTKAQEVNVCNVVAILTSSSFHVASWRCRRIDIFGTASFEPSTESRPSCCWSKCSPCSPLAICSRNGHIR